MTDNEFILQDRLTKIKSVVEQYGEDNFYIAFSGGKDSTVLSVLVDMAIPDNKIPRVFADTGIELNIVRKFVSDMAEHDDRVIIIKPAIPIKQMLEKEGYPFKSKKHAKVVSIYQRLGKTLSVKVYLGECPTKKKNSIEPVTFQCPQKLRYQFESGSDLKISDKCCERLKERPMKTYSEEQNRPYSIIGVMASEGGRRMKAKCLAFDKKKFKYFQPLVPVTKDWEEWFIRNYKVDICPIYKEPYNFERTGCKGCPFSMHLKKDLDILDFFFPAERKQCEIIWKPVYDEYRRIGYRLESAEPIKPEFEGQITFDDLLNDASCSTTEPVKEAKHEVDN